MSDNDTNAVLRLGQRVTIHKLDVRGAPVFAYPGVIVESRGPLVVAQAQWTRPAMALGYTSFEPGDEFTEWFYADRWYNIMEVRDQGSHLKGWYLNVTWPAEFEPADIHYRDLVLDLWVTPDGTTLTLDLDELDDDASLNQDERLYAHAGLAQARDHIYRRERPFDILAQSQP
ncbi:MAG TPA: DUF402 domain-containing protein [Ktedonobacterales bacterium]